MEPHYQRTSWSDIKAFLHYFFRKMGESINGVILNRVEYIRHAIEKRKNIQTMEFECKTHMSQNDTLFILYDDKGSNTQGDEIIAEVISYFEFKNQKIFKIHGQVHLLKGSPSDVDMSQE
ncbi:MAG: hypothetical protein FJX00_02695 [Alphaproteobacteria bacterium]|nr:hypothetical protein [Alphaproteobacteria bacterium]